jgi:glycosyltransferase involved in cell wall biosynthesis
MISVIIPAYNEESRIGRCLDSLVSQKTSHKFEVIVVDNDSTDNTTGVAMSYADRLDIQVINVRERRRGNARFMGCKASNGDVLFSTDADVFLPDNWLETGMNSLKKPGTAAVTGPYRIDDCAPHVNLFFNTWIFLWSFLCRVAFGQFLFRGANFAIKREAYFAIGQFDPNADAHEDTDLAFRTANWGKIVFNPRFTLITTGRRFKDGLLRGGIQYVESTFRKFVRKEQRVHFSNIR